MLIYQYANMGKENLIYPELSYRLSGILFAVHNELGRFRNEKQYADAIERHLAIHGIPYEREKILPISFVGEQGGRSKLDFLIDGKIVLAIKAKRMFEKPDYYQTKRYLTVAEKKLAVLVNFRDRYLKPKRILNSLV